MLNLDAKLHYQCVLLRAKMAACGLERAHSCWGVVLLASKGLLREPHSMLLCFDSGSFTARSTVSYMDTVYPTWIHSPRPKQETGDRPQGRLVFRARIQIVSLCVSENQERGVCLSVCDSVRRSHSRHVFTHKDTNIQALL